MFELSAENAQDYLGYPCQVTPLGGGVSNTVLLIDDRLVLKQSLQKLRVQEDWFSDRSRIFRESSAMRQLAGLLPPGSVPEILFEDPGNFLFAMTAAPPGASPWKDQLLRGEIEVSTAERVAQILGAMISRTWQDEAMRGEFGDQTVFDQLRLDPYYRTTAARHPDLASQFGGLMERSDTRRVSLVHGDWSPKNFLVCGSAVMAIDFEVIHFGDPSFDAAFLLNHLLLKSFFRPQWAARFRDAALHFWRALAPLLPAQAGWFETATVEHLGALLLARVDGKSPAEYIQVPELKAQVRKFARRLIQNPPGGVHAVFDLIKR